MKGAMGETEKLRPGTQGYDRIGPEKLAQWDQIAVETAPAPALALLSGRPGRALDVGAGSGRVSAWLAARGWSVDAVEPMAQFRAHAAAVHQSAGARWLDDALPHLGGLRRAPGYDLITCLALLSHLDWGERARSLKRFAELLNTGGSLVASLRLGAGPAERRHFEPERDRFVDDAATRGLALVFETEAGSVQALNRAAGTRWLWLGFSREASAP